MDFNSVSGGFKRLASGSHLDFISYWADRTVEEAVHRGRQLRIEKTQSIPTRDYNALNLDFIKLPESGRYRKKSPKSESKQIRSTSHCVQFMATSQSHNDNVPKRYKRPKNSSKAPCGMRLAELAVPTKRHCLETWKNKCYTLPDYMVERLRRLVTDRQPVVHISDAIYCFKRKCKRKKKDILKAKCKKERERVKKLLSKSDVKALSAIFGHKIAKKLIIPMNIILNSDYENIANVILFDIANLMRKSSRNDLHTKSYKMIEGDVVKKVTIWVVNILKEANNKILEDQLRDFEELAGPALDVIDDLVGNALEICIPVSEIADDLSTSESDESGLGGITEQHVSTQKLEYEDSKINNTIQRSDVKSEHSLINVDDDSGWQLNTEENYVEEKHVEYVDADEHIAFEQEYDEEEKDAEYNNSENVENERVNLDQSENPEIEVNENELNEDQTAIKISKYVENETAVQSLNSVPVDTSFKVIESVEDDTAFQASESIENYTALQQSETKDDNCIITLHNSEPKEGHIYLPITAIPDYTDTQSGEDLKDDTIDRDNAETRDKDEKDDEHFEFEDSVQPIEPIDFFLENTNETTDTFTDATEENKAEEGNFAITLTEKFSSGEDLKDDTFDQQSKDDNHDTILQPSADVAEDVVLLPRENADDESISQLSDNAETTRDKDEKDDEHLKFEDSVQPIEPIDFILEYANETTDTFTDVTEKNKTEEGNFAITLTKKFSSGEDIKDDTIDQQSKDDNHDTILQPSADVAEDAVLLPRENADDESISQLSDNAETTRDKDEKDDEHLKFEDSVQPIEPIDLILENANVTTDTFTDVTEENKTEEGNFAITLAEKSPSDIDRKVTFDASVNNEQTNDQKMDTDLSRIASIEHIDFAEPNEDLLSDADESWPKDVTIPVLRPSQSVSKSITSLGRIQEVEEKPFAKSIDNLTDEVNKPTETKTQESTETLYLDIEDQTKPTYTSRKYETKDKSDIGEPIKSKNKTAFKAPHITKSNNKSISERKEVKPATKKPIISISGYSPPNKSNKVESTSAAIKPFPNAIKIKVKNIKPKRKHKEPIITAQHTIDLTSNIEPKEDKSFVRTTSKPDYRVYVQTAPAWINRNLGERSCSCFHLPNKSSGKTKMNENMLRLWCQDLEKGYENLNMWNEWVDNTTRTVSMLRREIGPSYLHQKCPNSEWAKLKRNIDKDAQLWKKLNLHTKERLKCYKKMYQKRSEISSTSHHIICCSRKK